MNLRISNLILLLCLFMSAGNMNGQELLKFGPDKRFKIVQFTDIHYIYESGKSDPALQNMKQTLDIEKPDLVVYTGDVVTEYNPEKAWYAVTAPCRERHIPYVITFGNHDSERDVSRDSVYRIVTRLEGCLNKPRKESVSAVSGYGNQVVEIYSSSDVDKIASLIYLFDSHARNSEYKRQSEDWIKPDQIEWYKEQSSSYAKRNGGKPLEALAYFHIPLVEFVQAYSNSKVKPMGTRLERECIPPYNSGMFEAWTECKDILGAFVGHDHDNDYVAYLDGIALAYGRFSGGNNTYHNLCRGARVVELHEGERMFYTWIRLENGREWQKMKYPDYFTDQLNNQK